MTIDGLNFVFGSRVVVWICNFDLSNSTLWASNGFPDVLSFDQAYFSAYAVDTDSRFHIQTFTLLRLPVNEPTPQLSQQAASIRTTDAE